MVINTAMILAAGRGERLRPLTDETPKPLIQVGHFALIEHHLHALRASYIHRVVINLSYLSEKIEKYLGDGSKYGVEILYSYEPGQSLETAGGIRKALNLMSADKFLVVNADIRCDIRFDQLAIKDGVNMHLLFVENPTHNPSGDFALLPSVKHHKVINKQKYIKSYTYAGIGIFRSLVFEKMPVQRQPLLPIFETEINNGCVSGQVHSGRWHDVGTLERLREAQLNECP